MARSRRRTRRSIARSVGGRPRGDCTCARVFGSDDRKYSIGRLATRTRAIARLEGNEFTPLPLSPRELRDETKQYDGHVSPALGG